VTNFHTEGIIRPTTIAKLKKLSLKNERRPKWIIVARGRPRR
jgi:hypothetical protein